MTLFPVKLEAELRSLRVSIEASLAPDARCRFPIYYISLYCSMFKPEGFKN